MDYTEACAYLESLMPTPSIAGLERFRAFENNYGNPQDSYPSIHVAGSNGKGSVVAILDECLNSAGIATGRYTGPHLMNWTERIQFQGEEIKREQFADLLSAIKKDSESFAESNLEHGLLSWFELLTDLAFRFFALNKAEIGVFEVGLGGRWDATNVLASPLVCGIVTISRDHTHILGDTIEQIATEKAQIIKPGVPVITGATGAALDVIRARAIEQGAALICVDPDKLSIARDLRKSDGNDVNLGAEIINCIYPGGSTEQEEEIVKVIHARLRELSPDFQSTVGSQPGYLRMNSVIAAAILAVYERSTGRECLNSFHQALSKFFWPGRLQYFPERKLLLDGAHNEAGATALRSSLDELFPSKQRIFVLSFYKSKQFEKIIALLIRPGDIVLASQTEGRRAVIEAEDIVKTCAEKGADCAAFSNLQEAFKAAETRLDSASICIGTGSFVTVAEGLSFMGYKTVNESRGASRTLFPAARA